AARIGAEAVGRDLAVDGGRRRRCVVALALAQGDAERLLQSHRGRKRERPAAAEHFFQRRKAELGLLGQGLPRDAAAGEFFAHLFGHLPALLGGKLLVRRWHPCSLRFRATLADAQFRTKPQSAARPRRSAPRAVRRRRNIADHYSREAARVLEGWRPWMPSSPGVSPHD